LKDGGYVATVKAQRFTQYDGIFNGLACALGQVLQHGVHGVAY